MSDLRKQAERLGIKPPTAPTLRRYGITAEEWLAFVAAQGWMCPICEKRPNLWNTDHEHVPGWKNMPPERRKKFVRGVLCWFCNHKIVRSRIESTTVERVALYLKAYEARRDGT